MDIPAFIDRVGAAAMGTLRMLVDMPGETLAIVIVGVIGVTVGLACLIVGLFGQWREWAKIHLHRRHRY